MPKAEGKIDGERELEAIIKPIIAKEKEAVETYKKGDVKALNFLLGQVMNATQRRADFIVARKVLEKLLK